MQVTNTHARAASWTAIAVLSLSSVSFAQAVSTEAPASGTTQEAAESDKLSMSPAIVCRSIDGYEKYEELPDAALTSDEKLLVYFRPARYSVDRAGNTYRIHLSEEGQVRRRGEKTILFKKDKLLDYVWKGTNPPGPVYLRNTVAIKGLKPGEYDFDIILHDKYTKEPPATQTVHFRVIAAKLPTADAEESGQADDDGTPGSAKKKTKRVAPPRHGRS